MRGDSAKDHTVVHKRSSEIRQFILDNIRASGGAIVGMTAEHYKISRSSVRKHVAKLVEAGLLEAEGPSHARNYSLKPIMVKSVREDITPDLQEDFVYQRTFGAVLKDLTSNVADLCHYGFTEILNNAIHHSKGNTVFVRVTLTASDIEFIVMDDGLGAFNTILPLVKFDDRHHAVLELVKGKLTTDPKKHSGEGLFFTSRCFDQFTISCSGITLEAGADREWSIGSARLAPQDGTFVSMRIARNSNRTFHGVIESFTASHDNDYSFSRTEVPVNSARLEAGALTSRSQATRLLSRLNGFKEVVLDFKGVPTIGQGFADEIFRVFALENPKVMLSHKNANPAVTHMIKRARAGAATTFTSAVVDASQLRETQVA
jgi:anti-sigma regulatory factor (Ser/Thr protein kinase)